MKQSTLSKWLKFMIFGIGVCGLVFYLLVIPVMGYFVAAMENGVYDYCYWPWLIFIWVTAIPCYITLLFGWKIAGNIGSDNSFCLENATLLKWISYLAVGDALLFFFGNITLLLLNMNHPSVVMLSLVIVFAGFAIAVAAAVLSYLVMKAAVLQEQSDLTI